MDKTHLVRARILLLLVFVTGCFSWTVVMAKSGLPTVWGLGYWGPNGHDGIWHISLIESIKRGIPPGNPILSGTQLTNYHWGFDLALAIVSNLTGLEAQFLYFQITPLILSVLIGFMTTKLIGLYRHSVVAYFWALFFTYFGGNFGWIITWFRSGEISGESLFWSNQAVSTLVNPPFALSLLLLITGIYLIAVNNRTFHNLLFIFLTLGFISFFKSYAGVLSIIFLVSLLLISKKIRTDKKLTVVFASIIISNITILLLLTQGNGNILVFEPFWFVRTLLEAEDKLYLPRFARAWQVYQATSNYFKLIPLIMLSSLLFFIGNFGTRIIGLISVFNQKNQRELSIGIYTVIFFSCLLPLTLIQKGTPWNTIQFLYYGQYFLGIMAALALANMAVRFPKTGFLGILIFIFTLPTTISTLWYNYLPNRPPAVLPYPELQALTILKNLPYGYVFTFPYVKPLAVPEPPIPLEIYTNTAYVSAFSGKPVFIEDLNNNQITGSDWAQRLSHAQEYFSTKNPIIINRFLRDNHIRYIYLTQNSKYILDTQISGTDLLYDNNYAKIYRVR